MDRSGFGKRLIEARLAKGLIPAEVARAIGAQWHTYNDYEVGGVIPRGQRLAELAAAVGVTTDWLLNGSDAATTVEATAYPTVFREWATTYPLGIRLRASDVFGDGQDEEVLALLEKQPYLLRPSPATYDELARSEVAARRGKSAASASPPAEPASGIRPNRPPLAKKGAK